MSWFDGCGQYCLILAGATAYVGDYDCKRKYMNYFHVDDYATDKACIEAASAYAGAMASDGVVHIEPGTYTGVFVLDEANVTWEGEGWNATVLNSGNAGHCIAVSGNVAKLRDLQARNDATGADNHDGIYITADNVHIHQVMVGEADRHGIFVDAPECSISHCYITNIGNFGVYFVDRSDDSILNGTHINGTGDDGVYIHTNAENCVVDGNRITNWTGEGIDDDSGTSTVGDNDTT